MFTYTGHPLLDVGIATILAFVKKRDPTHITSDDLVKISSYMEENYVREPLISFLTVAFPNSGFTNPAFSKKPEKRKEYAKRILQSYRLETQTSDIFCIFTGKPAVSIPLSERLPAGKAFRQHIPLITGEGIINFFPWGDAGLPVSGEALIAIHAFPLGCAKCDGKLLAVHSDNSDLLLDFAKEFLDYNLKAINLSQLSKSNKLEEAEASAKTLLIKTLIKIEQQRMDEAAEFKPSSVTAYHLSNLGANPYLEIYHLPLEITGFLSQILTAEYKNEWNSIVTRAWWLSQKKKRKKQQTEENDEIIQPRRNVLYEDLFRLPDNAHSFIRLYFLRVPKRYTSKDDPRATYSFKNEADLVSWKITELFLRRVLNMNKEKIEQIKVLGDRLATYIKEENDRQFFTSLFHHRYDRLRSALIKANLTQVKKGKGPLITLDPYLAVFEDGNDIVSSDWRLSRDLVLIRMIEQLYKIGWLGTNIEAIPEIKSEEETE